MWCLLFLLFGLNYSHLVALQVSLDEAINWKGIINFYFCFWTKIWHSEVIKVHVDELQVVLIVELQHYLSCLFEFYHFFNGELLKYLPDLCLRGLRHTIAVFYHHQAFSLCAVLGRRPLETMLYESDLCVCKGIDMAIRVLVGKCFHFSCRGELNISTVIFR